MLTKQLLEEMKAEQNLWQNRISFYKSELEDFNKHLSDVIAENRNRSIEMPLVEHFQNQFIVQKERLDIIRHDFKQHENLMQGIENDTLKEPKHGLKKIHEMEREKLEQYEHIFHELRNEYNVFLDKNIRKVYQAF
jgi:site-specific recombinase XerD